MSFQPRAGDLVEVRTAEEIFSSLDEHGTLDGLPFMPEMLQFCGKRHRVFQRVVQAVIDTAFLQGYEESFVREFRNHDVVLLEGVRCSGRNHDGCSRGCMVFWKEAWLRPPGSRSDGARPAPRGTNEFKPPLRTSFGPDRYCCQSSEILKATNHLPRVQRLGKWFLGIRAGNYSAAQMIKQTLVWAYWRVRRKLLGEWPHGDLRTTPGGGLGLQPGELVEVKPLQEIIKTLDKCGKNRGLHFSPDMALLCGKQFRVRCRADNWIGEGTGKLCHLRDTVILEGAVCDSSYYAFGGCPRCDFQYWREIWLNRVGPPVESGLGQQPKPVTAQRAGI